MTITIRTMTRSSRGFYTLLGPYLARREIAKELGGPIWDDDGTEWFVALRGRTVLGFCALLQRGARAELRSSYVLPEHRRSGVYRQLFEARMGAIRAPAKARSVVRREALPVFRDHGFRVSKKTKHFHVVEKEIAA